MKIHTLQPHLIDGNLTPGSGRYGIKRLCKEITQGRIRF